VLFVLCLFFGACSADSVLSWGVFKDLVGKIGYPGFGGSLFLFLGVLLFLGWGVILSFLGLTSCFMKGMTTGKIIRSKLISFYDSDGDQEVYYIESDATYTVGGRQYQNGGRHRFSSPDKEKAEKELAGIKPGDPVAVFYSPQNPDSMTLESRDRDRKGELATGICFIGGGLFLSLFLGALVSRWKIY
jgi:hypothetical protein